MSVQPILPINGVPDELIRVLNDRLRRLDTRDTVTVPDAAVLPNVGVPGRYTKVTTDAQGRVIQGGQLLESDLPGGGYPSVLPPAPPVDDFYATRSTSISTVTATNLEAGQYLVCVHVGVMTSGTGNVTFTFAWTSGASARSVTTGSLALSAGFAGSGHFAAYPVHIDAGTSFAYSTTYTATGSYQFVMTLVQLTR